MYSSVVLHSRGCVTSLPNFFILWNSRHIKQQPPNPLPLPATGNQHSFQIWLLLISHMSGNIKYFLFSDWLISLNLMFLRFIHIVEHVRISFLRLKSIALYVYATLYLFIRPLVDTWVISTFWLFGSAFIVLFLGFLGGQHLIPFLWILGSLYWMLNI